MSRRRRRRNPGTVQPGAVVRVTRRAQEGADRDGQRAPTGRGARQQSGQDQSPTGANAPGSGRCPADLRTWEERCQSPGIGIANPGTTSSACPSSQASQTTQPSPPPGGSPHTEPFQPPAASSCSSSAEKIGLVRSQRTQNWVARPVMEAIRHIYSTAPEREIPASPSRRVQPAGCVMVKPFTLFGRFLARLERGLEGRLSHRQSFARQGSSC